MEKRWVLKKDAKTETIIQLIEQLGVSRPLANILGQRKIANFDQAKTFFPPALGDLHDPFLMLGMIQAVERIQTAITEGENILVYGDYDVDGTTAVATMFMYLTRTYPQVDYYIPDRYTEGYGISMQSIDFALDNSFSFDYFTGLWN
jgi:single-stranded-DNA-specific exonuclease